MDSELDAWIKPETLKLPQPVTLLNEIRAQYPPLRFGPGEKGQVMGPMMDVSIRNVSDSF